MQSKYDVKLTFWNHTSWSGVFSVVVADEVCQFCTKLPDNDKEQVLLMTCQDIHHVLSISMMLNI